MQLEKFLWNQLKKLRTATGKGGGEGGVAMSNLRMLCNLMDFGARSRVETESRKSETKIESAKRAEAHKENFGGNFISFFFMAA